VPLQTRVTDIFASANDRVARWQGPKLIAQRECVFEMTGKAARSLPLRKKSFGVKDSSCGCQTGDLSFDE
jgi:hypothetical protein